MHCANLSAACCRCEFRLVPVNPAGSRCLHALRAWVNAGALVSIDEPLAIASIVSFPELGSGNWLTPLWRMHSANLTAFPALLALPLCVPAAALEPHPLISATRAICARPPSGRRVLFMVVLLRWCSALTSRPRRGQGRGDGRDELRRRVARGGQELRRLAALPLSHHHADRRHPATADGHIGEERQAP